MKKILLILLFISGVAKAQKYPAPTYNRWLVQYSKGTIISQSIRAFKGKSGIMLRNIRIDAAVPNLLKFVNCKGIVIDNCAFARSTLRALSFENCENITIINSHFDSSQTHIYMLNCTGVIKVEGNQFKDLQRINGGGQAVQLDKCKPAAGSCVRKNFIQNTPGRSSVEDNINIFGTDGNPLSPLLVEDNYIFGGGPSSSGSGIMLGDFGGSNQIARGNVIVNTANVGIGIASGTYIYVLNNKCFQDISPLGNVGIYMYNNYEKAQKVCGNNTVKGNVVFWKKSNGEAAPYWFQGSDCPGAVLSDDGKMSTSLNANIDAPAGVPVPR